MNVIGVDVGGTFTDLIWADTTTGAQVIHKVPSTPDDPVRAVMTGARDLCRLADIAPASVDFVLHGTTIATNAVLEHRGARTGMITNDGFRDILHIARHQRP
jgi:N-methylhydantoinase A